MRIDYHFDGGMGTHSVETTDPQVIATFTAIRGNPALIHQAGWDMAVNHPLALPNETAYQFIKRHQATMPPGDPIKALVL